MTPNASPPAHAGPDGDSLIAVACPACHAALAAPSLSAGEQARCPLCLSGFAIPLPPRATPEASPPARNAGRTDEPKRQRREEKAARRARRNVMMLVTGVVILLAIVLIFGTRRTKQRR